MNIEDIDELALVQSEFALESLKSGIEWSIADIDLSGDDYYDLRDYAIHRAVMYLLDEIHLDEPDDLRRVIMEKLISTK
jgi:hypothetical protein